jgi:phosphate transport system substrate-binding protein
MSHSIARLAILLALAPGAEACGRSRGPNVTLAGSTSVQPFAEKWVEAYGIRHRDVAFRIQGGGSTAGIQATLSGAAQIGMSSRALTPDERTRLRTVLVARDGIAIVVHPTNPVVNLELDDVRAVYSGAVRSWKQFGGNDHPITLITREEGSGTRAAFESLLMGTRRIAPFALVQDSTGAVRQMVASDPAAIGYVSFGLVDGSVKAVQLHGIAAREANVDAGTYPLVRPFFFLVKADARSIPQVGTFLDWIVGAEGRALARREGLLAPPP